MFADTVEILLWLVMQTHAGRVQLGGQTDRVVVVDETFFTKKRRRTLAGSLVVPRLVTRRSSWAFWSCSCLLAKPLVPAC